MENGKQVAHTTGKVWTAPSLRRLSAGSAEAGAGTLGDGGGPGANRS